MRHPTGSRWAWGTIVLTTLAVSGCATIEPRPEGLPTREVDLADWSLASVDDLGWARLGVIEAESRGLVVYGLDATPPAAALSRVDDTMAAKSAAPGGAFMLATYRDTVENALGGQFNVFARAPAVGNLGVDTMDVEPPESGLVFTYETAIGGFTGFWIHLFETGESPKSRTYLDTRALNWVTFEVRGQAGGEQLQLRVADKALEAREDARKLGSLGTFTASGAITTQWQRVWVPLDSLDAKVSRASLASLIVLAESGASTVAIRDVAFTVEQTAPTGASPEGDPARPSSGVRAMWVWETLAITASAEALDRFTTFVETQRLTDVFIQIPYVGQLPGVHWSETWDEAAMGRIVDRMSALGVRVHALDGAAYYALDVWHARVVSTVHSVAAFNQARPESHRIHGMRFDIEPYLLEEFQGHGKTAVLISYFALLDTLRPITHAAGMSLGVDLPFWFDARDEITGDWAAAVDGRPASEAIMDRVDDVGLMAYRTSAFGADGLLNHISGELAYAERIGKPVLVGVETYPLPDETIYGFPGLADPQTPQAHVVVEPLDVGRARLTLVDGLETRRDASYGWASPNSRVLGATQATSVPASKITFAQKCPTDLARLLRRVENSVGERAGYGGIIVHSYTSFSRWISGGPYSRNPGPNPCHDRMTSLVFAP